MNAPEPALRQPAADPRLWLLDPEIIFLNHGSFGACPRRVLEFQNEWQARLERKPVQFLVRELEPELDAARAALAQFIGAEAEDLVFVSNATSGVNTVLRSLEFKPGDELLVTNQGYNACNNAAKFMAERSGARVVVVTLPFPFHNADELIAPVLAAVTPRTRLALLDHVTSPTGVVLPISRLVGELNRRGVDTLVDGAHAPGMVPLNLNQLGAAYYTGNCHKWLCAPKGAALLHVRRDRQNLIRPLTISHGANSARKDRSRFHLEFDWQGTWDPSAALSVPEAIRFVGSLRPGGWPEIMVRNRALALAARKILAEALSFKVGRVASRAPTGFDNNGARGATRPTGTEPCPEEFIGSLAAVPLPAVPLPALPRLPFNESPLQDALREKHRIEVPIVSWPAPPKRWVRVSAQLYNALPQYELLATALREELRCG
jgi:isopenicillin-N epimerase